MLCVYMCITKNISLAIRTSFHRPMPTFRRIVDAYAVRICIYVYRLCDVFLPSAMFSSQTVINRTCCGTTTKIRQVFMDFKFILICFFLCFSWRLLCADVFNLPKEKPEPKTKNRINNNSNEHYQQRKNRCAAAAIARCLFLHIIYIRSLGNAHWMW